jgi:WD40 repeat protein
MKSLWTLLTVALVLPVAAAEPAPQLKFVGALEGARPAGYGGIAFSPDGKLLAFNSLEGEDEVPVITLWDVAKRKERAALRVSTGSSEAGVGYALAFSPDGKTLAAVGAKVTLLDVATGKEKATFKDGGPAAFSPDGKTLAAFSGEHSVALWDLSTGKEKLTFAVTRDRWFLCSLAFSPDGKTLAVGSGLSGSEGLPADGDVTLWDAGTGKRKASLTGRVKIHLTHERMTYLHEVEGVPKRVILKLVLLEGREFPTEEDAEKELPGILEKILKGEQAKYRELVQSSVSIIRQTPAVWAWALAYSPDGKTLASGDLFGNVLLWDAESGKRKATLQRFNPRGRDTDINSAYSLAFSPDGKTLAAGTLFGIKLWDVESGEKLVTLSRPAGTVGSLAFSPDGKTMASSGSKGILDKKGPREGDATVRLWEWVPPKKAD